MDASDGKDGQWNEERPTQLRMGDRSRANGSGTIGMAGLACRVDTVLEVSTEDNPAS